MITFMFDVIGKNVESISNMSKHDNRMLQITMLNAQFKFVNFQLYVHVECLMTISDLLDVICTSVELFYKIC